MADANKDWVAVIEKELHEIGIQLPNQYEVRDAECEG